MREHDTIPPSNMVVDFDLTSIDYYFILLMSNMHPLGNIVMRLRQKMQPKWDTKGRETESIWGTLPVPPKPQRPQHEEGRQEGRKEGGGFHFRNERNVRSSE